VIQYLSDGGHLAALEFGDLDPSPGLGGAARAGKAKGAITGAFEAALAVGPGGPDTL